MHIHERNAEKKRINGLMLRSSMKVYPAYADLGKKVFSDGTRTVEFYHIFPSPHSNGLTVAYIPKEKILFQADYTLPAAGQQANDHIKALQPVIEKLGLDFEQYVSVHRSNTPQTKADLWKAVGK